MLRLLRLVPVGDEGETLFEADAAPVLNTELAAALAQLVRAALSRRSAQADRAA
jgi:hypothetical protein